jgi:carbon-monoxide dehydrogenase small subunit
MIITLSINNAPYEVKIKPDEYLLETLRGLRFLSVKKGCDTTSCGVCTILIDGKPVASCSYLSARAQGHEITTVEGIQEEASILASYLGKEGSDQCGYCNPGFTLTVFSMKTLLPQPSTDEIKNYLVGNLCRCSGYLGQEKAIKNYLGVK